MLTLMLLLAAQAPTAEQLLDRMDKNMTFEARRARLTMTVEGKRTHSFEIISYGRGEEDSAMEYVAPARDKGTKMLKLGDELWIYLPGVDRVQKISGHMMREGMMGSDISYEDLMASRELRTLEGQKLRASLNGSAVLINGAEIVDADIRATNGIIHALDGVLVPVKPILASVA